MAPVFGSTSQMAARPSSAGRPFSPTLLLDPTVTYSLLPSPLAITFLVQWWLMPAGRSVTFAGAPPACVWPSA